MNKNDFTPEQSWTDLFVEDVGGPDAKFVKVLHVYQEASAMPNATVVFVLGSRLYIYRYFVVGGFSPDNPPRWAVSRALEVPLDADAALAASRVVVHRSGGSDE